MPSPSSLFPASSHCPGLGFPTGYFRFPRRRGDQRGDGAIGGERRGGRERGGGGREERDEMAEGGDVEEREGEGEGGGKSRDTGERR